MKRRVFSLIVVLALCSMPAFAGAVHLASVFSADVNPPASDRQTEPTFSVAGQPVRWGFGWEVISGRAGLGGDYMVSFTQEVAGGWWLDWFAPALYLSWHPAGAQRLLDPSFEVGAGGAGRVQLSGAPFATSEPRLSLALFPFLAGGLELNLDSLLVGAKIVYTPFTSVVPVTTIPRYALGALQVSVTAGISLGW